MKRHSVAGVGRAEHAYVTVARSVLVRPRLDAPSTSNQSCQLSVPSSPSSQLMESDLTSSPLGSVPDRSSTPLPPIDQPPPTGDASFGLDPSADVEHHVEGHRWLPSMQLSARHIEMPKQSRSRTASRRSRPRHRDAEKDDVDSLPPSDDESTGSSASSSSSTHRRRRRPPPPPSSSSRPRPPTGSLTLSIFTPGISPRRRLSLFASSIVVNVCMPFVNGIMVGTGEIVARAVVVPVLIGAWALIRQQSGNKGGLQA